MYCVRELPSIFKTSLLHFYTTEINHNNMLAMMASIQRKLTVTPSNTHEKKFYSHTLEYLTSMSGGPVKLEDWMVASFDVEFGPEIGVGGL
jgi:hypothetical protein